MFKFTPKFVKSIERDVGLPMGLIKDVSTLHMNFYLKNKRKMEIVYGKDGEIQYSFVDSGLRKNYSKISGLRGRLPEIIVINENEMSNFLFGINFRGAKIDTECYIDGIPASRFIH